MDNNERNMRVEPVAGGVPIRHWTKGVLFEEAAQKQLTNIARLPFVDPFIAVMPDVHMGKGAAVGSVIPTVGAIVPANVGVDIGCGMSAVKLPITASRLPTNLAPLREAIEKVVPAGRTDNGGPNDRGAWGDVPLVVQNVWLWQLKGEYDTLVSIDKGFATRQDPVKQLGTLGTGNHFVELCLDENDDVWVVVHSGSRGMGNRFGTHAISQAKKDMERWFINLPDKDLAYIPEGSEFFGTYGLAITLAQKYAFLSRSIMVGHAMYTILAALGMDTSDRPRAVLSAVDCHHNYIARERHFGVDTWVTRKGAINAEKGKFGIIPGSMGTRSYIVEGKGNPKSLNSCSHGAGRRMSRTEAKRVVSIETHRLSLEGVECNNSTETLDETPSAYKDIDAVMAAQSDLVEVKHTLKQILCVKGVGERD